MRHFRPLPYLVPSALALALAACGSSGIGRCVDGDCAPGDGGVGPKDGGSVLPDGGRSPTDGGTGLPDGGSTLPNDGGAGVPDSGPVDAGPTPMDGGGDFSYEYGDGGTIVLGTNVSGLEFGAASSSDPGTANATYGIPKESEFDYYQAKGFKLLRIPFRWERLQTSLQGALDPTYLGYLTTIAGYAAARNMTILLDVHNYGAYDGIKIGAPASDAGPTVTDADFADLWTKIATAFEGVAGVGGYDLMNEPNAMPDATAWPAAAQAAVTAIRKVDTKTPIYVEGDHYASAESWVTVNGSLNISDPNNNLVYSAHCYLDRDSSGTYFDWEDEVAAGDTTAAGPQRIGVFVGWLQQHGYRGHIGELGAGVDNPGWNDALDNAVAYMRENNLEFTYWSAGPWWGSYPLSIEPSSNGADKPQMAVLTKYTGAAQPTAYYASGPVRGPVNSPSDTFTLSYQGILAKPATFTLSDNKAGGTFTPASVTFPAGFNGTGTFTYTASKAAAYAITITNNAGWTDPTPLGYSASTDLFGSLNASPVNLYSTRKVDQAYTGQCVNLRRASDGATQDFGFTSAGDLDTAAITTWANGTKVYVVTWYDQSGNGHNAGPETTITTDGGQATPADQPELVLSGQNGHAIVRFDNSRMDANSPLSGNPSQTILTAFDPTTMSQAQRLLSWAFTDYDIFPDGSGGWDTSEDSPDALAIGIVPNEWHTYFGRWNPLSTTGKQTYTDGALVSTQATTAQYMTLSDTSTLNIGWFRWVAGVTFAGDVGEMMTFNGSIPDASLATFETFMKSYWKTP